MTAIKQIQMIVTPPPAHYVGDGFRVHQIIPGAITMLPIISLQVRYLVVSVLILISDLKRLL